jgi:integrase
MKKRLFPKTIKSFKPGKDGVRRGDILMDELAPNLGVRVLGTRKRPEWTFVFVSRFPGHTSSARVAIGKFYRAANDESEAEKAAELASLQSAREKAWQWYQTIKDGRDPRVELARQRAKEAKQQAMTFGAVAEDFIRDKLPSERRGTAVAREIRKELKAWWPRPVSEIARSDITRIIKAKAKTAPASARNILGHIRRLFQWAIDQDSYDIELSPAAGIKPTAIIGEKIARDRVLDDIEFRAFWLAACLLPYPQGPMFQLLALTGCRLTGVSDARWSEFSPVVREAIVQRSGRPVDWAQFSPDDLWWTIPSSRVKGKNSKARPFMVPLTVDMLRLLENLPSLTNGGCLFSRNGGETPAIVSADIKDDLDAKMLDALRELAQQRGADPDDIELKEWVTHDLRRVVRSALSRLRVPSEVAESVLGHVRPGIQGVYDQHTYFDEKRDALIRWGALLRSIVEPAPAASNVVALRV